MLVAEKFIRSLVSKYGRHLFILMVVHGMMKHEYTEIETLFTFTLEKSLMERVINISKTDREF